MQQVTIGIHVYEDPQRLHMTLDALRTHTPRAVELLLLGDGPDEAMRAALASRSDLPQSNTPEALGAPACFNRLAALSDTPFLVFLENGAMVGPNWLEHLLAAFTADASVGLAGPTTNLCWNEQQVYARGGNTLMQVAQAAHHVESRFGAAVRTLEPLYSLSDFCYAVRREVFESIGGADESYGPGPCWEMDFNIRAARAGWRGVWACAAYVQRQPFSPRRSREESRRFEANKRLYQSKFCGARLRGVKTDFREHCKGDACSNFAPAALIELQRTLPALSDTTLRQSSASTPPDSQLSMPVEQPDSQASAAERSEADSTTQAPKFEAAATKEAAPLVSCIMPTCNRRAFIPLAIRCFLQQDYPNLELLVVDDGTDAIEDCLPADSRIRYIRLAQRLKIGAKRNYACERAWGEFIVHWDDDDWYPSWRVSRQIAALEQSGASISGTGRLYYYDAAGDRAWLYEYTGPGRPWVSGNTLAYRRSTWERHKFPDIQIGEDSRFVWGVGTHAVCDLAEPSLCVAAVHTTNTSHKATNGQYWRTHASADIHRLVGEDLSLLRAPAAGEAVETQLPLVTCIMPTYNRRAFIPLALQNFRAQDYPRKELLVVDDGTDAVGDIVREETGVRYIRLARRTSIGHKRNLACREARGDIIAHWDDDDWYGPERLRYQVAPLIDGRADITGLVNDFVLELPGGDFWTMLPHMHARMFVGDVHGGTICYRKSLLAHGIRYPEINLAEDASLIRQIVGRRKSLLRMPNPGLFIYVRHGNNAWREYMPGEFIDPEGWQRIAPPDTFSADALASYKEAATRFYASRV